MTRSLTRLLGEPSWWPGESSGISASKSPKRLIYTAGRLEGNEARHIMAGFESNVYAGQAFILTKYFTFLTNISLILTPYKTI
jgi:hypothetical protein